MMTGNLHGLRVLGLWALAATSLLAGDFAPPAEGPVAFRRDRLPLDADHLADLSRELLTLAEDLEMETPVHRRTAAQMLALSTALDPGNSKAREAIAKFQKGSNTRVLDPKKAAKSRNRVWRDLEWLESPQAGNQAHALAACLTDVMVISDPSHSRAKARPASDGEKGAWKGWIPSITAYEPPPEIVAPTPEESDKVSDSTFLLKEAQVFTVIWKRVGDGENATWQQGPVPLQMQAGTSQDPKAEAKPFMISVAYPVKSGSRSINSTLLALLKNQFPKLPTRGTIRIGSKEPILPVKLPKQQSISAAAAVLASAAISGQEPDATILGTVDENGNYELPPGFWSQLQSLNTGTGGRLILPAAAAEYLPSVLALERPQLFLQYEVLLATDFQDLLRLSAKTPDEATAAVLANFREIREKANLDAIGQYVANSFVRKRLVDVIQIAPYHFSAKMLAIQGSGNRPAYIPRKVLASELRRSIEPMEWMMLRRNSELDPKELSLLGETHDLCRAQLDQLFRYAQKEDRDLIAKVQNMVDEIRTMDRNARSRGDAYDVRLTIISAYSALTTAYREVALQLAELIGDAKPALPAE